MNHYATNVSPADVADPNDLLAGAFGPHILTRSFGDAAGLSNRVRR